ncbi:MAG: ATP-binding protein [Clostridia bacterium]|nr:ATP-binding protein [Clostridia bacterium]
MRNLFTLAENKADLSRDLPEFKSFSLLGLKEKIESIVEMIGKVENLFSTYTLHNMKHINSMLEMLDWLIPDNTKEKMSPVDWLLIVLSIYLHDLGMFVSKDEFYKRESNKDFKKFVSDIESNVEYVDYLLRLKSLSANERECFLYQEYVRKNHALRVKEWILGKVSYFYSDSLNVLICELQDSLRNLPKRFLLNLANVCESHDSDNLDNYELFPLYERYGSNRYEYANVQYAALILRTADLLHITKDRTPSTMYKLINISDPRGIDAWQTHMGTTAVYMKCKKYNPSDTDTHVIVVKADFSEETPFFSLTQYLAYADEQLKQTKRWAENSSKIEDAKEYCFPWHKIEGDISVEGNSPQPLKFELDRGKLLDLLVGHTLYNDPMVAIRELMQNAIDAVRYQFYLDKKITIDKKDTPVMGRVQVEWNPSERELVIKDNGIGMDEDVIKYHLMRVGSSFYNNPVFLSQNSDFSPISRFGIGILTCFMISDDIEIITCKNSSGHRIKMRSVHANYLLKPLLKGAKELEDIEPHGTRIKLKIRPSIDLSSRSIHEILKYWIILPECEVVYRELDKPEENIGFRCLQDALKHFYPEKFIHKEGIESRYDIVSYDENKGEKVFELAFTTLKGHYPEKTVVSGSISSANSTPAVCVEGIRVSDELPGFDEGKICAILSIRGNSKLRTTVSRSDLEYDDEYYSVAKNCAKLLFRHVADEVRRISGHSNNPLSQASSAGYFVYMSIIECTSEQEIVEYLEKLLEDLPLVVIEQVEKEKNGYNVNRKLVSLNELMDMGSFWTIESRLVDNLGTISRDIGKEMSINDFLIKNAPELFTPEINPVVLDLYENIKEKLILSHDIEKVIFSRKHQRTSIKWVKNSSEIDKKLKEILTEDFIIDVLKDFRNKDIDFWRMLKETNYIDLIVGNKIAAIEGDIEDIIIVNTRIIKVLKKDSRLDYLWVSIKQALITLYLERNYHEFSIILASTYLFKKLYEGELFALRLRRRPGEEYKIWFELIPTANNILSKLGYNVRFPDNPTKLDKEDEKIFDATDYWRDWFHLE